MKMFNVHNELVNIDVRPSSYPLKNVSRSKIQHETGAILQEKFPREVILEEFTVPGSKLSVDFFLPKKGIVIEVQGEGHIKHNSFFHKDINSNRFAKQVKNDSSKAYWAEINGFKFIEITKPDQIHDLL